MESAQPTVLHVISSLGQLGGGAERQLLLYFQHRSDRWRHLVAYRKPHALLQEEVARTGVVPVWLGPGGFLRQLARLLRLARQEHATVIHTHLFEANQLGRLVGRLLTIPVITTVTNTLAVEERLVAGDYALWKYRVSLALEALTGRWGTTRFIAISEVVKASAVATMKVAPSRVDVVYRAVRAETLDGSKAAGGPLLITTGRLVPHKGQDLLVQMMPDVLAQWPDCCLQVVGDGKARGPLERLTAQLGIASHVQFLGLRRDVHHLLGQADVYVYASWFEGFANAVAEAISRGLPVVAVDLPVFREIAPSSSVLLVERDPQRFAAAVLAVLADLDARRAAAAREALRFQERFSVQRYVRDTEAVYAQAAAVRVP